ncbi:MAG TPA: D-glycero-beta-D-manno-heptose-7-phosphate kinase [Bacteroidota bacterium]|nr:D-glycero-beta-D-manno-heptose-7-phosphate kinase [Bacteroidota bacterium]
MTATKKNEDRVRGLLGKFRGKRVAVVGDVMLDRYYWGSVHRVSPEAPVPVVEVDTESVRFGGAANVANNIQALGGSPFVVGLVGDDHPGSLFTKMMNDQGLDTSGIVTDSSRPTTIKTRVIAAGQHVVRIDNESKQDSPAHLQARLIDAVRSNIDSLDGIIIEDYNKGAVTRELIHAVIALAGERKKPVTVDPKFNNFFEYRGVTVFKPNRREVEEAVGGKLRTLADMDRAGKHLLDTLRAENVLLTRGEEGMSLYSADGGVRHLPTTAEVVQDVSGAGDTVIATLTMGLVSGGTIAESCILANCAGGVVVGAVGIVPVLPDQLLESALRWMDGREEPF